MTFLRLTLALALTPTVALAVAPPSRPLHRRIDQLLGTGPMTAPPAGDAEFLRRAYLDFTGCIPPSAEARAFLADHSPGKRRALIDRLLASPEHARHLATVLDVMLMERLPDRYVRRADWTEFLRTKQVGKSLFTPKRRLVA